MWVGKGYLIVRIVLNKERKIIDHLWRISLSTKPYPHNPHWDK